MVQSTRPTTGTPLITRHLYDGVRRIQDHLDDGGGFTLESEYIWGFGGAVDELIAHYDGSGEPFYAIHDLSGDLVALCDLNGSAGAARVLAQWTYDAYGSVLTAEYPVLGAQPPPLRVGHKGLFFDRLTGDGTDPQLWPHEPVVYHVRNRTYKPDIGRWLQRDPNETASPPMLGSHSGTVIGAPLPGFELGEWHGDGHNLYGYLSANPALSSDPTGLFGIVGGLMTGYGMAEMADDMMAHAHLGVTQQMRLYSMLQGYSTGQHMMAVGAMNMSPGGNGLMAMGQVTILAAADPRASIRHHVHPRMYGGTDHDTNIARMTPQEHDLFHEIHRQKMAKYGLPPENSTKESGNHHRSNVESGKLPEEQRRLRRRANLEACIEFDYHTGNRRNLTYSYKQGIRLGLYDPGLDVGRRLRLGRRR